MTALGRKIDFLIYKLKKLFKLYSFLNKKATTILKFDFLPFNPEFHIDIYTISFNNFDLVKFQIDYFKSNINDSFTHFIIDNSTDLIIRSKIEFICNECNISYYGLPYNPYRDNKSHAAAMHWTFKNIIKLRDSHFFGFVDHDIFPFQSYSIIPRLKSGIYGRVIHSYLGCGYNSSISKEFPYWSMWAGFCFFEKSLFNRLNVYNSNFFSRHFSDGAFLDTGGGLWDKLYSKLGYPGELATYRAMKISDKPGNDLQNQSFEILDESWIHFVSLSNWRKIEDLDKKKALLFEILESHK